MTLNSGGNVELIHRHVAAHLAPYCSFLLAFSGGLDSTVLLDILNSLRDDTLLQHGNPALPLIFRAVYIHHGLHKDANQWAAHCAYECFQRNIVFSTKYIVLNNTPDGIEAAARIARYKALTDMLRDNEVLLTAQHQDDQVETLLLALKRGSGPTGLSAMGVDTLFFGQRLIRPLLDCSREKLEGYARERGLFWIEDNSNRDLRFDRNFLRLQILPILRQRWPRFADSVSRSAKLCAEQEALISELLEKTLTELIHEDGSICLISLQTMSDIKRSAILRRWLARHGLRMPAHRKLICLWREVAMSRQDSIAKMHFDDKVIRRFRKRLYVLPCLPIVLEKKTILSWPNENTEITLPEKLGTLFRRLVETESIVQTELTNNIAVMTKNSSSASLSRIKNELIPVAVVRAPMAHEQVTVRFGPVYGLLYIIGRRHSRTLKKIWQELDIPPWKRGNIPMLFYNNKLIVAQGAFITWEGAVRKDYAKWHLFWKPCIDHT